MREAASSKEKSDKHFVLPAFSLVNSGGRSQWKIEGSSLNPKRCGSSRVKPALLLRFLVKQ